MTKEIKDHLSTEQQQEMAKLSKKQLFRLAAFTRRLYNNLCPCCKSVALHNPQNFQSYEHLCDDCKQNDHIINVFQGLQELNNEIKQIK